MTNGRQQVALLFVDLRNDFLGPRGHGVWEGAFCARSQAVYGREPHWASPRSPSGELGLAQCVEGSPPSVAELIAAMRRALNEAAPRCVLGLDGVARAWALVEAATTWSRPHQRRRPELEQRSRNHERTKSR